MSFTKGTQTEALAANSAVGSNYNTFTAAQYIGPAVSGSGFLPANFFPLDTGVSKSIWIKAFGVLSTTGTPTFNIGMSLNTTQGTYNSSGVLATISSAFTTSTGLSFAPWEMEVIATCSATGASGGILASGLFKVHNSATAPWTYRVSSSTNNPNTALSVSTESAYYVEAFASFGTSNAANLVQCYNVVVLGLN